MEVNCQLAGLMAVCFDWKWAVSWFYCNLFCWKWTVS